MHERMAARMTELRMQTRPQPGPRALASARAREAFLASFSREIRLALDHEERLLLVEGPWQSILGWQPEQLHGWYWGELVHPGDRARVQEVFDRIALGQLPEHDVDVRLALSEGGYRLTYWTFAAGSGTDSIVGLGRDSTDLPERLDNEPSTLLRRRNAELAARLEELEARYTAVERFAGAAAHQLAEPLVIAESSAILVADELGPDLDPMLRDRLDAIGRSTSRARRLMDALLADARRGGLAPAVRPIALSSVVDATLGSLEPLIEAHRAAVVVGPLPHVQADPALLEVVLDNLMSNALKYGPRTDGRIDITAERRSDRWRLSVASGGKPIAPEEAAHIFQPFHRLPSERRVRGIGLGLTICARLMERLGGAIGVDTSVDSGNTFWITLPAAVETPA
jgi:signal transduction histidine kinase